MSRAPSYDFYESHDRVWSLASRLSAIDESSAKEQGQALFASHAGKHPSVIVEESTDGEGNPVARVIWRSPGSHGASQPPPLKVDIGSRLFMVIICGVAIGALGAIGAAIVLSAARGSVSGTAVGVAFLSFAAAGALTTFKFAIPVELMLWRNKSEEARQSIIELLKSGSSDDEPAPAPAPVPQTPAAVRAARRSARKAAAAPSPVPAVAAAGATGDAALPNADPANPGGDDSAVRLAEFIEAERAKLQQFADIIINAISGEFPELQAFQRYGFNLYLAGAVEELVPRDALTPATAREVLIGVLVQTGTDQATATTFCDRLATSINRPRYKRVFDAGRAAMIAVLDNTPLADDAQPGVVMRFWASPNAAAGASHSLALLLTDLVGSTAMTGKLGNAGAQRVVRAHNSIVRAALKNARGTEIKHTGDGILVSFNEPVQAAQAGIEIQQEIVAFCRANPELPLAVRIGLHAGEVSIENGELSGDPVSAVDDVASEAGAGEICASKAIEQRSAGGIFKYIPFDGKTVSTEQGPQQLFKLMWQPKAVHGLPPVEYRQIGGKPAAGDGT